MAEREKLREIKQQLGRWTRQATRLLLTARPIGRGAHIMLVGHITYRPANNSFDFAVPKSGRIWDWRLSLYNEFQTGRTEEHDLAFVALIKRRKARRVENVMIVETEDGPLSEERLLVQAEAARVVN